jgi:hypothetical protein
MEKSEEGTDGDKESRPGVRSAKQPARLPILGSGRAILGQVRGERR